MLEKALRGSKTYWVWMGSLVVLILIGLYFYLRQLDEGLGITGMGRDVSWGFYIAQFTFLVGVAASAVMVVLPYYLHNYKVFGKMTIFGEFLAIPAVLLCMLFICVDMGQPQRVANMFLYPTPNSVMFWDATVLMGYLILNVVISRVTFGAEKRGIPPPNWIKPIIYLSIPWAFSIHTVTAFLYAGLGARPFWFTAIMAPRFLASAFAGGPAILILLTLLVRKIWRYDVGDKAISKLTQIVAYAMVANCFFVCLEMFTVFYSGIQEHIHPFQFLYTGLDGKGNLMPWAWISVILSIISLVLLVVPRFRQSLKLLPFTCIVTVVALWIDKGLDMVITGFIPNPLGYVIEYSPTIPELLVSLGIYAVGAFVLSALYKIALTIREQLA